ncbi:hypothetical protein QUC31_002003 [Theobroma cacao]
MESKLGQSGPFEVYGSLSAGISNRSARGNREKFWMLHQEMDAGQTLNVSHESPWMFSYRKTTDVKIKFERWY